MSAAFTYRSCLDGGSGMSNAYNSHSKSIGELLGSNEASLLVVPRFQRGYSWEKKHVEAFWKDIIRHQRESQQKNGPDKYFLGPFVTMQRPKEPIQILDGQQRLATATIWFCVIRDIARAISKETGTKTGHDLARDTHRDLITKDDKAFVLQLGEMDRLYFNETVQRDEPIEKEPAIRSHQNIQRARAFLKESTTALIAGGDPAKKIELLGELQRMLRRELIVAVIPVDDDREAFKIFETLNDRGLRLSVPDLLLNYLMGHASEEYRQRIRDCWNEMLEQMGTHDISRFLRHMWISKYGDLKDQNLFDALKDHIEDKRIASVDFANTCADECVRYTELLDLDEELGKAIPNVRNLLRRLNIQAAFPLLLSALGTLDIDDFQKLVRWLLVYVVRYSIIANLDSSGLETVLFKLALEVRQRMTDPKAAASCLAYIKETLVASAPSDKRIAESIPELILGSQEAKYLLGRLATHMQTKTKEIEINESNIEHIFPQNPDETQWPNKKDLTKLLWHIGNLTILGKRLNREAANKSFATKKAGHYIKSELIMTQRLAKEFDAWDAAAMEKRAATLTGEVLEIWNFDNPSRV
jgi:hypothetical protein